MKKMPDFVKNDPDKAFQNLKEELKKLSSGTSITFLCALPPNVADWVKNYCKKSLITVNYSASFRYKSITKADIKADKEKADKDSEFWTDYFNSP